MPCLLAIFAIAFPRIAMIWLYLTTNFFTRAYQSILVLALGFIFLPLTTILYAWIVNAGHDVSGLYMIAIIVAALFDIGLIGGGEYGRRRR
jgi:hypothetical protein